MGKVMAFDDRPDDGDDQRRSRARSSAMLLAGLAAALYVGFIAFGFVKGLF